MDRPEDLHQIETIFHRAVGLSPDTRESFLDKACGQNTDLRREVESLLAKDKQTGLMGQPAMQAAAQMVSRIQASWRLASGARLGSYEIIASIGAGGMAEVYRARDSKLNRDVAIKVLPEAFAQDRERVSRFHREAQLLASLNHPRIAAIYGLEESDGLCGLALEFIDGETLAERIARGRVSVKEALELACQIAEALEAAHSKGVVHRDLKPANIKVTREGTVKVLDFGLAKAFAPASSMGNLPTKAAVSTEDNIILGTVAYMSPEQARGKDVDKRTDIWAWGCVLYEMLTGGRTFRGDTTTDVIAKIVAEEPAWEQIPENTPPSVRILLRRTLQKDVDRRLRDIGDARIEIDEVLSQPLPAHLVVAAPFRARHWHKEWTLLIVAGLVISALSVPTVRYLWRPSETQQVRFEIQTPTMLNPHLFAVSPDGRKLAYVASADSGKPMLFVRPIDSFTAESLPGTEDAFRPFWSPDSRYIAFGSGNKLKKVLADRGTPQDICDLPQAMSYGSGTWNSNGVIVFSAGENATNNSFLFQVSPANMTPARITTPDSTLQETGHLWPFFLPDGRHFLFLAWSTVPDNRAIYVGSLDSQTRTRVKRAESMAVYAPPGFMLVQQDGTLLAQPFDLKSFELSGETAKLGEVTYDRTAGASAFSVSDNGTLIYRTGVATVLTHLTWVNRAGVAEGEVGSPGSYGNLRLSPDDSKIAVSKRVGSSGTDVWIMDLTRGTDWKSTTDPADDSYPIWSPNGDRIVFSSRRDGPNYNLYIKNSDGSGNEEPLWKSSHSKFASEWSADGQFILISDTDPDTKADIWIVPLDRNRKPSVFLQTPFNEQNPHISHDGHWIAYVSDVNGKREVFVQAFSGPAGKQSISTGGGIQPKWRSDDKELYYLRGDGSALMAVDVVIGTGGGSIKVGVPHELFRASFPTTGYQNTFDVNHDGSRFIINTPLNTAVRQSPISVVLNWSASLKKQPMH